HGAPQNLLIAQAILVSIACMAFLFLPSVNASYWLLTGLSAQLYMLMYVIMFLSALRLRKKISYQASTFTIPGKTIGLWSVCLLGLIGCSITICVGFIPPGNINIGSKMQYEIFFCSGLAIMLIPTLFFYWYQQREASGQPTLSLGTPSLGQPLTDSDYN
ncbi:MAG: amino acid permease, partial [Gammaproteobacteria bacterium]